ncbi:MAG TPA: tRNA (cytosine(32)/uridine(32)-2'-O)-methyltransferase TrmJ, partial [Gammaproteobacteria bacterium]|nr:tRNA (cytosine(32)/uridine(32)-2'-O)-methyltransferase TrmJ [Gammaproteobacteria bacterium]
HPGNIGSSARAMKTMGLKNLSLVAPKVFPSTEAEALASGATDLLQNARVVQSVEEAVAAADWVVGTSSRARAVSMPTLDVREAAHQMADHFAANHGEIAILFGPERTGLTNHCLDRCHQLITIPTSESYASLNLAAAVQIVAYELRLAFNGTNIVAESSQYPLATAA